MVDSVVNVHEAKSSLSALLRRVENGEEIVIARAGEPAAKLVSYQPETSPAPQRLGAMKGLFGDYDDIDAPMPDDWLRLVNEGPLDSA